MFVYFGLQDVQIIDVLISKIESILYVKKYIESFAKSQESNSFMTALIRGCKGHNKAGVDEEDPGRGNA